MAVNENLERGLPVMMARIKQSKDKTGKVSGDPSYAVDKMGPMVVVNKIMCYLDVLCRIHL